MSPDEVLAHLPPESEDELTLVDDLPASPLAAFRPVTLPCPQSWAQLAPRYLGLTAGRELDAWCFGGVLFARAQDELVAFGRIGFLRLPLDPRGLEEHARWPEPGVAPRRAALALSVLLGLRPILDKTELHALTSPSTSVGEPASPRLAEAWRAPYLVDDELCFFGAAEGGGPVHSVRANLATRWLDLCAPNNPPHNQDLREAFDDATEPLSPHDETVPEGDETEIT